MTQEEARTLKVGDLVMWRDPDNGAKTIEIVVENGCGTINEPVQLRTIAVLYDPDDECNVGDEGWMHEHNCVNLERVA